MQRRYLPGVLNGPIRLRLLASRLTFSGVLSVIAIAMTGYSFYKSNLYEHEDLQAIAIGEVDETLPLDRQDRLSLRFAVVNSGTREAGVLQAEVVALHQEPNGGYSWVRIFPPIGEGFQARTFKPGEIAIISLTTNHYASEYFMNPRYSRVIDDKHHEFALGMRIKSIDSHGQLFDVVYVVSQFKIRNDFDGKGPPSEGFTFDPKPHPLLVNTTEQVPRLAARYDDSLP